MYFGISVGIMTIISIISIEKSGHSPRQTEMSYRSAIRQSRMLWNRLPSPADYWIITEMSMLIS